MKIQGFACCLLILVGINRTTSHEQSSVLNGQPTNLAGFMNLFSQYFQSMQNQLNKKKVSTNTDVSPTNPPTASPIKKNRKTPVVLHDYQTGIVHLNNGNVQSQTKSASHHAQQKLLSWQQTQKNEWLRKKALEKQKSKGRHKTGSNQYSYQSASQVQQKVVQKPEQYSWGTSLATQAAYQQLRRQRQRELLQKQKKKQELLRKNALKIQQARYAQLLKQRRQLQWQQLQKKARAQQRLQQQRQRQQQLQQQKTAVQLFKKNSLSVQSKAEYLQKLKATKKQKQKYAEHDAMYQYAHIKENASPAPQSDKALEKPLNDKSETQDNPSQYWMNSAPASVHKFRSKNNRNNVLLLMTGNGRTKPRVRYVSRNRGRGRRTQTFQNNYFVQNLSPSLPPSAPGRQAIGSGAGCPFAGYFLPDPSSRCFYLECVSGNDPWPDQNGNIPLGTVRRPCGVGTAVPAGYGGGSDNPCTSALSACKVAPVPQPPVVTQPPIVVIPGVCSVLGQFLADPHNPCGYRLCVYNLDPWPSLGGMTTLIPVPNKCSQGTGVPTGYIGGLKNPCTVIRRECVAIKTKVCSVVGQFLADPSTRCQYLECSYGLDPWPDANGVIPLIQVPRRCAPGTAVPVGYVGGVTNPCTSGAAACKAAPQPGMPPPVGVPPPFFTPAPFPPPFTPAPFPPPFTPAPFPPPFTPAPFPPPFTPAPFPPPFTFPPFTPSPPFPTAAPPPVGPPGTCFAPGVFIPDPTTQCGYLECMYNPLDPWPDGNGNIPLVTVQRPCGNGSGVPPGYIGGVTNPCTARPIVCGGDGKPAG